MPCNISLSIIWVETEFFIVGSRLRLWFLKLQTETFRLQVGCNQDFELQLGCNWLFSQLHMSSKWIIPSGTWVASQISYVLQLNFFRLLVGWNFGLHISLNWDFSCIHGLQLYFSIPTILSTIEVCVRVKCQREVDTSKMNTPRVSEIYELFIDFQ